MRAWLTAFAAALLLSGCGGSGTTTSSKPPPPPPPPPGPAPPATVSTGRIDAKLYAPTHEPKINARWRYRVLVADSKGRGLDGRITVEIVDPLGVAHPADYDDTTRKIRNMAFKGEFRDYVEFPPDARGFRLTFRVIVKTAKGSVTITYPVTPK
jgi:hypothetical protein